MISQYKVSIRRACRLLHIHHSVYYYQHHRREDRPVRARIKEIAETKIRFGLWRVYTLLRREGWPDNHKRVHRIYKEEGLNLRRRRPRRSKTGAQRMDRLPAVQLYQCFSMDFVSDALFDGRKFRCLTIVDNYSRECLAILVGQSLKGKDVVNTLEEIKTFRGIVPERIQTDNGSEFISKEMDKWAYDHQVTMDYSRPGKPTDNALVESFNGSFRDECLNAHWFLSLEDAKEKIESWRMEYNHYRPHSSLDDLTPAEFVILYIKAKENQQVLPEASDSDKMISGPAHPSSAKQEKSFSRARKKRT